MKLIVPADKANHYIIGQAIFSVSTAASYLTPGGVGLWPSVGVGIGIVSLFAIGKEVYDRWSGKGTPEVLDAVATIAGAVPPIALLALAFWKG